MNPSPRLRWQGWEGNPTENPGCGHLAMENTVRAWWQSRYNLPDPPDLVRIDVLARQIRSTHQEPSP
jgi:hypothetical protein